MASGTMKKLLVVAAFEPELTDFRALVRGVPVANIAIAAVGVGLVEAAIGMAQRIAEHRPSHALLLGTCGAFAGAGGSSGHPPLAIGSVVTARRARLIDGNAIGLRSAIPAPMPVVCDLDETCSQIATGAGARLAEIANTLGITVADDLAASILPMMGPSPIVSVEHLEAFAFARACAAYGVAGGVVLVVANFVGSRGREEWRHNHVRASERAARVGHDTAVSIMARA